MVTNDFSVVPNAFHLRPTSHYFCLPDKAVEMVLKDLGQTMSDRSNMEIAFRLPTHRQDDAKGALFDRLAQSSAKTYLKDVYSESIMPYDYFRFTWTSTPRNRAPKRVYDLNVLLDHLTMLLLSEIISDSPLIKVIDNS